MGAYLVWFPRDRVRVLVLNVLVLVPASTVIGCWIAIQLAHTYLLLGTSNRAGGVAYLSHIGGAATGIIASLALWGMARTRSRSAASMSQPGSESLRG